MSNDLGRMFKRKRNREEAKRYYKNILRTKQINKRKAEVNEAMRERWKKAIENSVPTWQRGIACFIPPRCYLKLFMAICEACPSEKWADKILQGNFPHWRKVLNIRAALVFRWIVQRAAVLWILWIRGKVATFGIRQKIVPTKDGHLKMVIYYWFQVVDEYQIKV